MRISAEDSVLGWLMRVAASTAPAAVGLVSFASGYTGFGVICVLWAAAVAWSLIRYPDADVFVVQTGVQIVRKDVVRLIPFSRIIEVEPYGRGWSHVRITFHSEEDKLETFRFAPTSDFGRFCAAVKVKDYLCDRVLRAPAEKK